MGCHSLGGQGLTDAITAGCDSIEHGYSLTQDHCDMMAEKGLFFDPTIVRYTEPYMDDNDKKNTGGRFQIRPIIEKNARMCIATKGVKTVVGTGAEGSTYAHGTQGLEFIALVRQGGMTPVQALQAGTVNAAELMQWQNHVGSISKGKIADIYLRINNRTESSNKRLHVAPDLARLTLHAAEHSCQRGVQFLLTGEVTVVRSRHSGVMP